MPIKREIWECKYKYQPGNCNTGVFYTEEAAALHEKKCLCNPEIKSCFTCSVAIADCPRDLDKGDDYRTNCLEHVLSDLFKEG